MVRVRVPASSANMGPGFDCLGVALNMYNEAEFIPIDSGLEIEIMDEAYFIPRGENNFVYKGFKRVFDELGQKVCPIRIKLWSNIPVTRGLGSSSSSIVLGLMGANGPAYRVFDTCFHKYLCKDNTSTFKSPNF